MSWILCSQSPRLGAWKTLTLPRRGVAVSLALGALATLLGPAPAETPLDFRVFPMPGGAPVALPNGLLEDREGTVWVATWGEGVHRLHGTEWKTYTEADGLPDNWNRAIAESAGGGVWIGTGEGLALLRDDQISTVTPAKLPLFAGGDVSCVLELPSGQVLAGTVGGTILLREPVGTLPADLLEGWRVLATPENTHGHELTAVLEARPGEWLLALAWGGLGWMRDGAWQAESDTHVNGNNKRFHILHEHIEKGQRELWAMDRDSGQIYRYDQNTWTPLEVGPRDVNDLAEVLPGTVFAATQTGLFRRDETGWQRYELEPALGMPELSRLLPSRDGTLWAGGREGLLRGTSPTWMRSDQPGGPTVLLPRTQVNDPLLAMNFAGVVFAPEGTGWRTLFTLDPWTEQAWILDDSIWMGDGRLWREPAGGLRWIMVANGTLQTIYSDELSIYSLEDGHRTDLRTLPPTKSHIERFFVTGGGSLLYMADEGVYRLDEGAWTPFPTVPGYTQKHAFSLEEIEPGVFWAGVAGGIERWAGSKVEFFDGMEGVQPDDDVHAIRRDRKGNLWFGSMGSGLYRYDGHTFENLTKANGLRNNSIRALLETSDGTLWVANRSTGVSALRGDRWLHYSLEHGLPNASALGFAETSEGVLWTSSQTHGLFRFRPDGDAPDTEILVGPEKIDSHGIGVFSFTGRDAWNQTPIRDLQYTWRVTTIDPPKESPWSPFTLETTVVTSPLEHGSYRFEVRSSDENGNPDSSPAHMDFVVLPPLWMKPGFYLPLSLSIILAIVAVLFQWFSRKALLCSEAALRNEIETRIRAEALLEQHSENLEELVEERTRVLAEVQEELIRKERLATLGQLTATVSHELRNPLGTIQSSLYTIEKRVRGKGLDLESALDRTARSVRRCDKIIEELLDFTRANELYPVATPVDPWLKEALDDIGAPDGVHLVVDLQCPAWIRIDQELMRRVLVNLLDNAVQAMNEHGSPEPTILIRTREHGDRVEIQVEDTGPGIPEDVIERIFEPLFSTRNFGVGLGTSIMRNIMLRHNGGIEYANREGAPGTRVLLWLPSSTAHA